MTVTEQEINGGRAGLKAMTGQDIIYQGMQDYPMTKQE
jgi:hypothetical protein